MSNPDFSENKRGMGGRATKPPMTGKKGSRKDMSNVKPAFPSAGVPGKTQKKSRNAGIPKAKVHPKSEGL